jgi:hypothetical protein
MDAIAARRTAAAVGRWHGVDLTPAAGRAAHPPVLGPLHVISNHFGVPVVPSGQQCAAKRESNNSGGYA